MPIGTPTSLGSFRSSNNPTSSNTFTTSTNLPGGACAFVWFAGGGNSSQAFHVSSVSDGTNTYSQAYGIQNTSGANIDVELWIAPNCLAVSSGATITVSLSASPGGSGSGCNIGAFYVTGLASIPTDKTANSLSNTATPSVTTGTLSQANEIVFGSSFNEDATPSYTESSGFTNLFASIASAGQAAALSYQIVSSTSSVTYAPTWSATGIVSVTTIIVSFEGGSSSASTIFTLAIGH